MKIETVTIDWHDDEESLADPELVISISGSLPADSEFIFKPFTVEDYPGTFYHGHSPYGFVRFFWEGHKIGQKRTLKFEDGTEKMFINLFSSRSGIINMNDELDQCIDVRFKNKSAKKPKNSDFTKITIKKLVGLLRKFSVEVRVIRLLGDSDFNEVTYTFQRDNDIFLENSEVVYEPNVDLGGVHYSENM